MQIDNKKIYTGLAAAALVAIAAFAVIGRWDNRTSVTNPQGNQGTSTSTESRATTTVGMEVVTITSSSKIMVIRAEYPRFPDVTGITQQIDSYVAEQINLFRDNALESFEARNATLQPGETPTDYQYSLDLSWESAQINGRFISVLMRVDAFEGGANVRQEARAFNWDVQGDKEVTLAALFNDDASYLARISEYTAQVLKGTLNDSSIDAMIDDGTAPSLNNFQSFTFTDDAIIFVFPKYQVAPGAAGEQKVVMPRNVPGLF